MADTGIPEAFVREAFDAYMSAPDTLVNILGSFQKEQLQAGNDWIEKVHMIMTGMDLHDSGSFPDEWWKDYPDLGNV